MKEIAHGIETDCPFWIYVDEESLYVKWAIKYDARANDYDVDFVDFEHFYWTSAGIDEALFDSWLTDGNFVDDYVAHCKWAEDLMLEIEILRDLCIDNLNYEVWKGTNLDSARDNARALQVREQEVMDLIERDAISTGL